MTVPVEMLSPQLDLENDPLDFYRNYSHTIPVSTNSIISAHMMAKNPNNRDNHSTLENIVKFQNFKLILLFLTLKLIRKLLTNFIRSSDYLVRVSELLVFSRGSQTLTGGY